MSDMLTTSDSSNPELPLDVLHCILDMLVYLHEIDTLKSFSMVCRILRPLCAKHIYATQMRPSKPGLGSVGTIIWHSIDSRVNTLLEVNPTLVQYMKHLHLSVKEQDWKDPSVLAFLNQLQNVNTLQISSFRTGRAAIPEPVRMTLGRLISSPHLIHLDIRHIENSPFHGSWPILDLSRSWMLENQQHFRLMCYL
ncbi:hypothetical protein BJ912DRAFT_77974 [Pholiota molesta]|nr:hypothetical protein BJ912DRAFT_77974 [Pholiota molesta]